MNYETLKMYENDELRCGKAGSNAIHLAAKNVEQPTIGYGYDLRQNGFSANDLNSKVGRTVITQEQMDQIKNYSNSKPAEGTPDYKAYLSLMASITITEAEATQLLQIKVREYEQALNSILSKHNVSLNDSQKSALISLFYSSCGATVGSIEAEHPTLTKKFLPLMASTDTTVKFYAKMGMWYEIAYRSNGDKIHLNRRFAEANEFLGHPESEPLTPSTAKTVLYVSNVTEANMAISFMNANKDTMYNAIKNATGYPTSEKEIYKYIQDSFSDAVPTFLSNQNYTGSYNINTLFTEWNLYTDLQVNTSNGTTSYGNITGSDKRDLIFITGEQDGTTVHAGSGDDFIGGGSKKDIIYSGSGNDVIYTYGGDDTVYTTDGKNSDRNEVYLGAGGDTFKGGNGVDIVDGGSGATGKLSGISLESMMDTEDAINKINLGGGADVYYGGKGKDIVDGGSGDDKIFAGDGNNEINGGSGHDIIETGFGDDIIHAGTGRDKIDAGSGINHIYLGNDNFRDEVYLSNRAGGIDHIYQMTSNDIVHYNSNIVNTEYSGKDVIQTLANGAKVILHDFYDEDPGTPEHGHLPAAGANGAPLFVMPDGRVWGYGSDGKGYQDTGYSLPSGFPGKDGSNGEVIPPKAPGTPPEEPNTPLPPVDDPNDPGEDGNTPEETPDGPEEGLKGTGDQPLTQEEIDKGIKSELNGESNLYGEIRRLLKELAERIAQQTGKMITTGETTKSPLIVDLDGDGVETTTVEKGVHFDHDGNGFAEKTAWVGKDDGLLVRDINGNGQIDDGTELFGNNSVLSNGQKATNGFEALADLDSNNDGVFDAQDAA